MAKSVYSDLHHLVSGSWLALHQKMWLSAEQGEAETQDKIDFKRKTVTRDKEGHYIIIKGHSNGKIYQS